MPTAKDTQERSARAAFKDLRARDAAVAAQEYAAEGGATLAKTARLRALRLEHAAAAEDAAKIKPKTTRKRAKRKGQD